MRPGVATRPDTGLVVTGLIGDQQAFACIQKDKLISPWILDYHSASDLNVKWWDNNFASCIFKASGSSICRIDLQIDFRFSLLCV